MAYEDYCAACTYLGESIDSNGKYYCDRKGDVYACDSRCYNFTEAYSRSNSSRENMYENSKKNLSGGGCYLTTITCQILNLPDNNYYLQTLRNFRNNVMQTNPEYFYLLLQYDIIGPTIANKLSQDANKEKIATHIFDNYIKKAVEAIKLEDEQTAINIYADMTNTLSLFYQINTNINVPNPTLLEPEKLGHGKTRKLLKQI